MNKFEKDEYYMGVALDAAKDALKNNEVPVGAVIVLNDEIIAVSKNNKESNFDPSGHAEINAIRIAANKLKRWRLNDCVLYVTLEPCPMCTSIILESRISRVCFGAYDPQKGGLSKPYNIKEEYYKDIPLQVRGGVLEERCQKLLNLFFDKKRQHS